MTEIYEDLDLPGIPGGTPTPASVTIRLAGAQGRPTLGKTISTNKMIAGELLLSTANGGINSGGLWRADLVPNSDILPDGTTYLITRRVGCSVFSSYVSVPITGGPYEAFTQEDDPLGAITPSALSAHASRLDLHGGGIEYDYKYIDTVTTVTGSGGGIILAPLTGTQVTVPDVGRPVYLQAWLPVVSPSGAPLEQTWALFNVATGFGAFAALDATNPAGLNITTNRGASLFARLPAHSPGNYVIAGTGTGGNLVARAAASTLQRASLRAYAA